MKEKLAAGIEATRAILMSAPAHPDIVKGVVFDGLKPLLYLCRLTEMRNEREQFDAREVSVIRMIVGVLEAGTSLNEPTADGSMVA